MRGKLGNRPRGRRPRDAPACGPGMAAGAAVHRGRGMTARLRGSVMASQHMGGLDRVMRHRSMCRSQGQTRHQQSRQGQGEEPVSQDKGSTYHHRADPTLLGLRFNASTATSRPRSLDAY
jgi:hypothetical protein